MQRSVNHKRSQNLQETALVLLRLTLPLLVAIFLFWPLLIDGHILAFRDTLHFYYPLWKYLDARQYSDWLLPQFNYFDFAGVPIIGEPTSMVFYPPRLLLKLPGLSLEQCIGIFLCFHVCLCWYGSYYVSRRTFRRSSFAASLLASGYAFGGVTYFTIYNPPYLVSSAWLPLAFGSIAYLLDNGRRFGERPCHHLSLGTLQWQSLLTISLTAMFLGGDVQTPYNLAIICAITFGLCLCLRGAKTPSHKSRTPNLANKLIGMKTILIPFSFAGLLSAIQLLPTYHWYRVGSESSNRLRTIGDEYTLHATDALTWFVPGGLGSYTPTHTRWIAAYDNATVWTPSLHMALPVIASLAVSLHLVKYWRIRWLAIVFSFCAIAAFGDNLALYSGLSKLLPFYEFRFPMKWYAIAAFVACIFGGYGLDITGRYLRNVLKISSMLIFVGLLNTAIGIVLWLAALSSTEKFFGMDVPGDRLCGAFNPAACYQQIAFIATVTGCASFLISWLCRGKLVNRNEMRKHLIEWLSLGQLVIIAWLMTNTVSTSALDQSVSASSTWHTADMDVPIYWDNSSSKQNSAKLEFSQKPRQPREAAAFQRQCLEGKMHLLSPGRSLFAQLSLTPQIYAAGPKVSWLQPQIAPEGAESELDVHLHDDLIQITREQPAVAAELKLPILNDGGWSTDEPDVEIVPPEDHLLAIRLPEGVKDVKLTYCAPGLKPGACVSFLALVVSLLVICKRYV